MPMVRVGCVDVDFPYDPYECQISYMSSVINALDERRHAILESPTGTGKTVCLLCATLGWLEYTQAQQQLGALTAWDTIDTSSNRNFPCSKKFDIPLIIFSSRTHAQLNQAIQAFKNTAYSSHRIGVLGSRDQLCLLPEVAQLETNSAKVYQCRLRVKTRTCDYYRNFEGNREKLLASLKTTPSTDIEDLVKIGKETRSCPYYLSREMTTDAEVLFMPYNYLLDSKIRQRYGIELNNAVVIFDEAHNIEQVCEDAASANLTSSLLASAIEELRVIGEYLFSMSSSESEEMTDVECKTDVSWGTNNLLDLTQPSNNAMAAIGLSHILTLKGQLIELERLVDGLDIASSAGTIKPGEFVFELLGQAGITPRSYASLIELIGQIIQASASFDNPKFRHGRGLTHVADFLQKVFLEEGGVDALLTTSARQEHARCYRVHIKIELMGLKFGKSDSTDAVASVWRAPSSIGAIGEKKNVSLSYWCLTPGRAMHELLEKKVRNVILTSGTLYPMESLKAELNLPTAILLQNPHVIAADQLHVAVLPKAADGGTLNSGYTFRDNAAYHKSLGVSLVNFFRIVPRGIIIFFPSYALMRKCIESWQNSPIYNKFLEHKKIFLEPKDKGLFQQVANSYIETSYEPGNGAALFSVMRGKASEGLDLADHASRAVVIVGLPYPPCEDPRVKIKMAYLDERRGDPGLPKDSPTGRQWYKLQAWRAINQSVGRAIRHVRDYGAIFLCDERFASAEARSNLPAWLTSNVKVYDSFGAVIRDTTAFYRNAERKYPVPIMSTVGKLATASDSYRAPKVIRPNAKTLQTTSFPLASTQVISYVDSFATSSTGDLFSDYGSESLDSTFDPSVSTKAEPAAQSLLDMVYSNQTPSGQVQQSMASQVTAKRKEELCEDDLLQARLLKCSAKRIKLIKEHENTETSLISSNYIGEVKRLLAQMKSPLTATDNLAPKILFSDFQTAVKTYKQEKEASAVDAVFTALSRVFLPVEAPGLLRDFVMFVREGERERYSELCKSLTGLACNTHPDSPSTKNDPICSAGLNASLASNAQPSANQTLIDALQTCPRCHKSPIVDPLKAPCMHCCCFACWRVIIERDNRRCPLCGVLVRRRNLVRIVQ